MNGALNKLIKRHTVLTILSVIAVIIIAGGTSYALFLTTHDNTRDQVIDIGTFDITLSSSTEKIINRDIYTSIEYNVEHKNT